VFQTERGRLEGSGDDQMSEKLMAFGVRRICLQIAADAGQLKKRWLRSSGCVWHLRQMSDEMMFLCSRLALVLILLRCSSHPKALNFFGTLEFQI
jgi:hypothetical protein